MKCDYIVKSFLKQEDSEYLSPLVRFHLIYCSKCRDEIERLRKFFVTAQETSPIEIPEDMSDVVMRRIFHSGITYKKNISTYRWFTAGAVIFASIFIITYSESVMWLREHFGRGLEIPLHIVLGFMITFFAASYIGAHLDGAKKVVNLINEKMHQ